MKAFIAAHIRKLWLKDIQKDIQFVQQFQSILDLLSRTLTFHKKERNALFASTKAL